MIHVALCKEVNVTTSNSSSVLFNAFVPHSGASQKRILRHEDGVPLYLCPQCCPDNGNHDSQAEPVTLQYIYMLHLLLVDQDGWLVAGIWKEDAVSTCILHK